jgi:hypothetical protein
LPHDHVRRDDSKDLRVGWLSATVRWILRAWWKTGVGGAAYDPQTREPASAELLSPLYSQH